MKKYYYYENGFQEILTTSDLQELWNNEIDKSNFSTFENWIEEMEHMQILIEK